MTKQLIRNFSIIAHIDHGKTTLTDRILMKTGTIGERQYKERMLDSNPIEQERGVTIKLAPVRMKYKLPDRLAKKHKTDEVLLNLIDTPGHVDFGYEVSRSLAACEGAVLLIDASQGVQAQTLTNYQKAVDQGLKIIPVLNKIDLPSVDVEKAKLELMEMFDFEEEEILTVSAKTGEGVEKLLDRVVEVVPEPGGDEGKELRGLVFSSQFDAHQGVVAMIRVVDGVLKRNELTFLGTTSNFTPQEVGVFVPTMKKVDEIGAGEVGYVATGLKDIRQVQVGDTLVKKEELARVKALPGYKPPQLMVFMDFYPVEGEDFTDLKTAMEKLKLHDAALAYSPTHSIALGNGLRVGFLGIFHAEIVQERLEREFDLKLVATSPSVRYEVELNKGEVVEISSPADLPDPTKIKKILEPVARVIIFCPKTYIGSVLTLCDEHRGVQEGMEFYGERVKLTYLVPLPELIVTFYDELKSVTSGFASMEYAIESYQEVDAIKLNILINHDVVEPLSQIVVKTKAVDMGKRMAKKLKEVIPRQLFEIPIQAAIGGKIIARENISAFRKDVTAKLYGGDRTRRMKLLEKQKKGKMRRAQFGKVDIPQEAFMSVLKRD